jgi:hypothetical protein
MAKPKVATIEIPIVIGDMVYFLSYESNNWNFNNK